MSSMSTSFQGVIQPSQIKQHLAIQFQVPKHIQSMEIDFEYQPHQVNGRNNLLTLTLFDPHQPRGEGHKMEPRQKITITPNMATPGYIAGEIPSSEWTIVINTHMVLAPVTYRLEIRCSTEEISSSLTDWPTGKTAQRGLGWYRGDLHGHTIHSDGHWDIPDWVAYARSQRLDFATLSDHNTISGLAQIDSLATDELLTMGGMELTTYYGHALALGLRQWIDWRVQAGTRTMSDILQAVQQAGGLFIIAHPMSLGDPVCTGCDWQYMDVMPGLARCIEIWNGPWDNNDSGNEKALQLWYQWLNQGYHMVGTAGSDIHSLPPHGTTYGRATVYAEALSERAILDAVRQGHLYLSAGPHLELRASMENGQTVMMGDHIAIPSGQLTVQWKDAPAGSLLRWLADGEPKYEFRCGEAGSADLPINNSTWALVELRDAQNRMLAITNPIFFGESWR